MAPFGAAVLGAAQAQLLGEIDSATYKSGPAKVAGQPTTGISPTSNPTPTGQSNLYGSAPLNSVGTESSTETNPQDRFDVDQDRFGR